MSFTSDLHQCFLSGFIKVALSLSLYLSLSLSLSLSLFLSLSFSLSLSLHVQRKFFGENVFGKEAFNLNLKNHLRWGKNLSETTVKTAI